MNVSYHALFFLISYTVRPTPFDFFKVKWMNSYIFNDMDARTYGLQVGKQVYE